LPVWQVKARVNFYKFTGIVPYLFVVDKADKKIYFESILKLEKTKYHDTPTNKRRIYNITNFKVLA
jgi:hypothetical protein